MLTVPDLFGWRSCRTVKRSGRPACQTERAAPVLSGPVTISVTPSPTSIGRQRRGQNGDICPSSVSGRSTPVDLVCPATIPDHGGTGALYLGGTGVLYLCGTGVLYHSGTGVLYLGGTGALYHGGTGVLYHGGTGALYTPLQTAW